MWEHWYFKRWLPMMHSSISRQQLVVMRIVVVSRKTIRTGQSYFLLDFCGRPRNGSLYRRLQAYSLPSEHTMPPSLSTRARLPGAAAKSLSFCGGAPKCPGVSDWFSATSQPLSLARCRARLESAWRKRIRRAARHPLKLWPRRQFRLFWNPLSRWSNGATFRRNL